MGADLCSTLGDVQMICVLAWGCLPPVLRVGVGGGSPPLATRIRGYGKIFVHNVHGITYIDSKGDWQ